MLAIEEAEAMLVGAPLVVAQEGAVMTIRALLSACLQRDIPVRLGPCPSSG